MVTIINHEAPHYVIFPVLCYFLSLILNISMSILFSNIPSVCEIKFHTHIKRKTKLHLCLLQFQRF